MTSEQSGTLYLNLTRRHNTVNLNSFFLQLRRIRPNHTDPSPLKSVSFCIEVVDTSRSDFPGLNGACIVDAK